MIQLVPTILTNDKNDYLRQYNAYAAFAPRIQVDICDGVFTPTTTIDLSNVYFQPGGAKIDLHLMIMNPAAVLDTLVKLQPHLVILHAEIGINLLPIFQALKQAGIKTGLALLPQTFPGRVAVYLQQVDHCLIFAGALGRQGGQADLLQTEKIPLIRQINPRLEIAWDGGVNLSNIRALGHVGLDVINIGSALSGAADPKAALKELSEDMDKNGVVV